MTIDDSFRRIVGEATDAFEDVLKINPSAAILVESPLISWWTPMIDQGGAALHGRIIGHPSLPDRTAVTSILLYIDLNQKIARTKSRWYRLGDRGNSKTSAASAFPHLDHSEAELRYGNSAIEISEHKMHSMIAALPKELLLECMYRDEWKLVARLEQVLEAWPRHQIIH